MPNTDQKFAPGNQGNGGPVAQTNPNIAHQVHAIDLRLTTLEVRSEDRHAQILKALQEGNDERAASEAKRDEALTDLLEASRRQLQLTGPATTGEVVRSWKFALAPGTAREVAMAVLAIGSLIGGPAVGAYLGTQAQEPPPISNVEQTP